MAVDISSSKKKICGEGHWVVTLSVSLSCTSQPLVVNPSLIAHRGMVLGGASTDRLEGGLNWGPHLCMYRKVVFARET